MSGIALDPLYGTGLETGNGKSFGSNAPSTSYIDVSMLNPDDQYNALVSILDSADLANPAQDTLSPPGAYLGEGTDPSDIIDPFIVEDMIHPPPDMTSVDPEALQDIMHIAPGPYIPEREWWNDPQVHGAGVAPGYENDQYYETGHTQIVLADPGAEQGWDAWSGRVPYARVAQIQNSFPGYSAGVNRGMGQRSPIKLEVPLVWQTQQYRDMLLAEIKRRGVHGVVVSDVASVPYTEQVIAVDPTALTPEAPIGSEGVLPW